MTNDEIRERALAEGFKRKLQPDGSMDLSPYVFNAIRACQPQWISVDERQPEHQDTLSEKDKCLVITKCGKVWMGFYNTHLKPDEWYLYGWSANNCWHPFEITHWMPLPTPPNGD